MQQRLRRKLATYLSATLLLSLLSSGLIAPSVTTESAKADLVQPTAPSLDLNNECDQNDISTSYGVYIKKVGDDCVIQFRAIGTYSWRVPDGVNSISRLLVVGGGGGGGARHGGGGGAGGYVYKENVAVTPNANVSIVVGNAGGRAGGYGNNGQDSLFNNAYRAKGGGGGGSGSAAYQGAAGGSGGGATGNGVVGSSNQVSAGDKSGLGNAGGAGTGISPTNWTGGGGGGSGGAGTSGNAADNRGGNGGAGTLNDITGEYVCYAAGGGGGASEVGKVGRGGGCINPTDSAVMTTGAQGGNNAWGASYQRDLDAAQNTGSGGGGGGFTTNVRSELGGAGGSGVVIVRYKLQTAALDLNAANYSGTGTTWLDSSTSVNKGVLQNAPTFFRADANTPAFFRFDGTKSQYVSTTKAIAWPGPRNFSGGVWFRTSSNQAAKIIGFENTQTGTGTGSYDRHLYIGTDNRLYWGVYDGTAQTVKTLQKVNDGKWHYAFFTSTWTYAGNIISLSLDNGPARSLSMGTAVPFSGYWRIAGYQMGSWTNARTGYFTGDIARATIYPYVLTPEQARNQFAVGQAPTQVTARASTTETAIKASWRAVPGVSSYKVNVYNEAGTALVTSANTVELDNVSATSVTIRSGIVANIGYRISVTPKSYSPAANTRSAFFNESAKSEVVVPGVTPCKPEQSFSGPYTVLQFKTENNKSSSCSWTAPSINTPIEYLLIGGGGGGGQNHGAGGGGGFYNTGQLNNFAGATATITVGAGGAGGIDSFFPSKESDAMTKQPNPLRNGQDGASSVLTTTDNAIIASGGSGGLTTWDNLTCRNQSELQRVLPAKTGTPVVGKYGLAGGIGGGARGSVGGKNSGTSGFTSLSLKFNQFTTFASGGPSGAWVSSSPVNGVAGAAHTGNGGGGGDSDCRGGGAGGSGTVILRYLTPQPKAAPATITLPDTGTSAIYARFQAEDFNTMTKTWEDSSGNNRDAYVSKGNPRLEKVTAGTNNAKNDFIAVTGSPSDGIQFFALPKNYTMFHVARYNGANKNRIFQATGNNWLSGFWAGRVGVAYHDEWLTPYGPENNKNPDTDWIISTDKRNSYRSQGVDRTIQNASYQVNPATRFGINDGSWAEFSDFQVAEVIIYNRELSDTEVAHVETYLQRKYTYQNPDIIGNVSGGGWRTSQYCPAGKVAVGVRAVNNNKAGFSSFRLICQGIAEGGQWTNGLGNVTPLSDIGNASGTIASFYCDGTNGGDVGTLSSDTRTSVVKGWRLSRGNVLGSNDYYVAGLRLICGPVADVKGATTESTNFFGANAEPTRTSATPASATYYPEPGNPSLCPAGQVVIGFNAKSGSVTDAIQAICGVPPLPTLKKPTLVSGSGVLKTLIATWETSAAASSYAINVYESMSSTLTLMETIGLSEISKDTNTVTLNVSNFPEIKDNTAYRITVTANGDGINTLYSPASEYSEYASTLSAATAPTWDASNAPGVNGSDSKTVTPGMSLTIYETVTVGGSDHIEYQWFKDGKVISGATGQNLTLTAITSDSAGVYTVKVTNTFNGSKASATSPGFTLDVLDVITPQVGITKTTGKPFVLKIETKGLRSKTFSMSPGDSALVTALGLTLDSATGVISGTRTAGMADSATIQVMVTSYDTSVTTAPFRLKFVDSALESPTAVTLTPGTSTLKTLVAKWNKVESATAYSILLYDSSSTLVTTRGLVGISDTTTTITTSNYESIQDGETYTVRVIAIDTIGLYADSDSSSTAMAVTSLPPSALNLSASVTLLPAGELKIAGTPVTLTAVPTGTGGGTLSYQWYRDGLLLIGKTGETLSVNVTNGDAGTYTVEVTNSLFGESVTVTSSGQTISVVDGVKVIKPINGLVTAKGKPYRLQLSTSAGTSPITFNVVSGYTLPTGLTLNSDSGIVTGTPTTNGFFPIKIVAKDANNSYDTTTVFTISVVESQLDSATVTGRPSANTLKSIDISWAAVDNANRYVVRLYDADATNASKGDPLAEISGVTGTSYTLTTSDYVGLEDATRYKISVVAVDANGQYGDSEESVFVAVTTNSAPSAPVFTTSPVESVDQGLGTSVTFTTLATATGAITYQWYKDDVEVVGATNRVFFIPSLAEKDEGVYSVVATSTLNGVSVSTAAETKTTLSVSFSVVTPTQGLTAAVGKKYSLGIQTVGGESVKTFLTPSDSLPSGLKLNENTGEISGVPETTTAGMTLTVKVKSGNTELSTTFTLKVVVPTKTKIKTVTADATPGVLKSIRVNWAKEDATTHLVHLYDAGGSLLKSFLTYDTATGTSFTITPNEYSRLQDSTDYKLGVIAVGDDTTGNSEESDLLTVKTNAAPERPTVIEQPGNFSVAIGGSVTLTSKASINDAGTLSYQWFKGSDIIPGATSDSYTIAAITTSDLASYRVRVTNALNGATASVNSQNGSVAVLTDLKAITPTTGLKLRTGVSYRLSVESTGGAGENTWSVSDGLLPTGLTLDSRTALITGTPSDSLTAGTVYTVTLQVKDRYNATSKTERFALTLVESASVLAAPTLTAIATRDTTKSISLEWTQVESATSYSVYLYDSAGTLIATKGLTGLTGSSIASTTINANNYADIATSTKYLVSVVANYDGDLAIGASVESTRKEVTTGSNLTPPPAQPLPVAPPAAPTPQVGPALNIIPGAPFNIQVDAPGANNFVVNGGRLPTGLILDPATGRITGTATESGPYSFSILATPPVPGKLITYSGNITAPAAPTPGPELVIVPGEPFNTKVDVPGATDFTVYGGKLPAGLILDPKTGEITGTPTESGPYDFTILATPPASGKLVNFKGTIVAPQPEVQPTPTLEIKPGSTFDYTPNVPGANNFVIKDGKLPAGLTLDPATGRISGTPRESGPYSFSILATPPSKGVLLTFSGTVEAPDATVVNPVVNPTIRSLDPIIPATAVLPTANSNLLVVSSGEVGTTTVLPNSTGNGLIVTSLDVILSVAGVSSTGSPTPLNNEKQLTLQTGLQVEASGTGFLPDSEIYVYMFSTPQLIGKIKTDANGEYSAKLTVPTTLAGGNHVLQVNGFLKSNEVKSISLAVIVNKPADPQKPDDKKPSGGDKKPTTKPAATKSKKITIGSTGKVIRFNSGSSALTASAKKLIKKLKMPKGKEVYVLGYASNSGRAADILVALNRAIAVSQEIKRLNPKAKVGYAGMGTKTAPQCVKLKNLCAVVTVR